MLYKFNGKPLKMLGGSLHVWGTTPGLVGDIQYWTCNHCGYDQNPEGAMNCGECGYYRYWALSTWNCWNCGHENSEDLEYCEECGQSRYGSEEPPPPVEYDWECPNCQHVNHFYDNNQWDHYCEECGFNEMNGFDTPPDSGDIPPEPDPGDMPPEDPPVDDPSLLWECPNCSHVNISNGTGDDGDDDCSECFYNRKYGFNGKP